MERTGGGYGGRGTYLPRDPNAPYDAIDTGPPSLYLDPGSVQAAPFNPQASPIEPMQLPYYLPEEPPDYALEHQPTVRG